MSEFLNSLTPLFFYPFVLVWFLTFVLNSLRSAFR